jgi:hypothetical protein
MSAYKMPASLSKADMRERGGNVRYWPILLQKSVEGCVAR